MTITPTPADATRSLTVLKLLRSLRSEPSTSSGQPQLGVEPGHDSSSSWILRRLALTVPGLIVMTGGLGLLALLPEARAVGIVTFLAGTLLACSALVVTPTVRTGRAEEGTAPAPGPTPSAAELDAEFVTGIATVDGLIDSAAWLVSDGLERTEAVTHLLALHRPTRELMEEALVRYTQRMHRGASDDSTATQTLRLLIAATAVTPWHRAGPIAA